MLFKRLILVASFGALAAAPALAATRGGAAPLATPDEAAPPTLRRHGPRVVEPGTRPDHYDETRHVTDSYNTTWAGYAVTGTDFTHVAGSWIVTSVDCATTPNAYSSQWVGIDGWSSETVEQIGTDTDCSGTTPSYYVWYEFYPEGTRVIKSVSIAAGDVFSAQVTNEGSDNFKVSITNQTSGESFSKTVNFTGGPGGKAPKLNSAEWIEERDGPKLADFGTDPFGEAYTSAMHGADVATDTSTSGVIAKFGKVFDSIATKSGSDSGADSAVPSDLAKDGSSFNVTWYAE